MELRQTCFYKPNRKTFLLQVMLLAILIGILEKLPELNTLMKLFTKDQLLV
jgi:hypothetical protein